MLTNTPGGLVIRCKGPRGRPAVPGNSCPCPRSHGLDRCPRRPQPGFLCPRLRRALLGDLRSGAGACWVDQLSQAIGPMSKSPWCRPGPLGDSRSGARARGVDQLPRRLGHCSEGPRGQRALRGDSCIVGLPPAVDQLSRTNCAQVRARPAFPGGKGPVLRALVVDQLSRATQARVQVRSVNQLSRKTRSRLRRPAVSTSSPG